MITPYLEMVVQTYPLHRVLVRRRTAPAAQSIVTCAVVTELPYLDICRLEHVPRQSVVTRGR